MLYCELVKNFLKHKQLLYFAGTNRFFRKIASKANLESSLVDATDVKNVKAAMKPNTKVSHFLIALTKATLKRS